MGKVISDDKHYKGMAEEIRNTLGVETKYKPSEIAQAITDCQAVKSLYDAITNGYVCYGDSYDIRGNKVYPGTFAGSDIETIELHDGITSLGEYCFYYCKELTSVILRNDSSVCALSDTFSFNGTPIKDGKGYIYVPSALLDSYKTDSGWSTCANQFRPLEDYTVDGTVTGAFDSSKI